MPAGFRAAASATLDAGGAVAPSRENQPLQISIDRQRQAVGHGCVGAQGASTAQG